MRRKKLMQISKDNINNKKHRFGKSIKKPNSFWVKIACFLAAFMVWFYAAGEQSPTISKTFPSVPVNIPKIHIIIPFVLM